jgi:hypothetical protein
MRQIYHHRKVHRNQANIGGLSNANGELAEEAAGLIFPQGRVILLSGKSKS